MVLNQARLAERVARARSVSGLRIRYRMGSGGMSASPSSPASARNACDCSGFVAWCLRLSRKPKPGRDWWLETTRIHHDAIGAQQVFRRIEAPVPGCIVVYPDIGARQGHVGIVTAVLGDPIQGVDCSASSWRRQGDAIQERDFGFFLARPDHVFAVLQEDIV